MLNLTAIHHGFGLEAKQDDGNVDVLERHEKRGFVYVYFLNGQSLHFCCGKC